jgi:hypothetical protein
MRATYRRRPGWTKAQEGRWDYRATIYRVRHCGHPTSLWPYYGEAPDGRMILTPSGRGFRTLNAAQAAVEAETLGRP